MALTVNEQLLVDKVRVVLPEGFSLGANDEKILAYINLVIGDFNVWPIATTFTANDVAVNPTVTSIIIMGCCVMAALFQQMNAAIQDFTFSDQGFSVTVSQVDKIQQSITNMLAIYQKMITAFKTNLILDQGPMGISSPRYQSQLGQFLKISLGCFLAHTRVATNRGWVPIAKIQVGTKVLSHDGKFHKVLTVYRRKYVGQLHQVCADNSILSVTAGHHILDAKTGLWVPANKLVVGQELVKLGDSRKIVGVESNSSQVYQGTVYDLEVEDTHTYNAEGIIVHNSAFNWNSP